MEMSPKYREKSQMYEACATFSRDDDVRNASKWMQELFTQGTLGTRIRDAQKLLCAKPYKWTRNRVVEVFRGEAKRIDGFETWTLAALRAKQLQEAREEHARLTAFIVGMEETLTRVDENFHRDQIDALRASRGEAQEGLGGVAGSRAGGERE